MNRMFGPNSMNIAYTAALAILSAPGLSSRAEAPPPEPPRNFAYVLQADALGRSRSDALQQLSGCGRDWIIIDPFFEVGETGRWTPKEIEEIRAGQPGRKVLAYLSIGEAERYRSYWQRAWDSNDDGEPDQKAPQWLCAENPEWEGNYKTRYWDPGWQEIVLQEADRILSAGFDGIYLDIVDAFEFFEYDTTKEDWIDGRSNPATGKSYRQDMTAWVCRIAEHSRRQHPGFLVVPQNGIQLLDDSDFLRTIDAVGVEDLFADGNRPRSSEHVAGALRFLANAQKAAKPVLVTEYGTRPSVVQQSRRRAEQNNLVLLLTDRGLRGLGRSAPWPMSGE